MDRHIRTDIQHLYADFTGSVLGVLSLFNYTGLVIVVQLSSVEKALDYTKQVRNARALAEYFQLLDVHKKNTLNDLQLYHFLHYVTDLTKKQIMLVFDLLDWNATGEIGLDEFYMLVCILMSHENHLEKQFIYQHSGSVFELLVMDGGHTVGPRDFQAARFLFNIKKHELEKIFKDFDVSGDEQLNYKEFKMFTIFCIDRQQRKEKEKKKKRLNEEIPESSGPELTKISMQPPHL